MPEEDKYFYITPSTWSFTEWFKILNTVNIHSSTPDMLLCTDKSGIFPCS